MSKDLRDTFSGKAPPIWILILLISMASIGSVLFTPGLPSIARFFNVSITTAQYAITIYVLGYALAQLIHGPLVNYFGRKPVLLWGTALAVLFSLLSGFSKPFNSMTLLMTSRLFTALASGVGLIVSLTIINDVFTPKKITQVMPVTAISFAVLPGVAICFGGFITEYFGWEWCFYFLAFYYLIGFICGCMLSETMHPSSYKEIHLSRICHDYGRLLIDARLLSFGLMVGMTSVFIYVYAANGPGVAIDDLKLSESNYGLVSLLPFIVYALGNLLTSYLNKHHFPIRKSILIAFFCILILTAYFGIDTGFHAMNIMTFYIVVSLIFLFIPVIWSNASVQAVSEIEDKANSNAILSFLNISGCLIGLLLTAATSSLNSNSSMAIVFIIAAIILAGIGLRNYFKYPV